MRGRPSPPIATPARAERTAWQDLLDRLAADLLARVRAGVACNIEISDLLRDGLAGDHAVEVRAALAANGNARSEDLPRLAGTGLGRGLRRRPRRAPAGVGHRRTEYVRRVRAAKNVEEEL
jgi:hypothetical protein